MPVPVNEAILALNRHNQRIAQSLVQRNDDVPDLLVSQSSSCMSTKAMERLSHDTAVSQLSLQLLVLIVLYKLIVAPANY